MAGTGAGPGSGVVGGRGMAPVVSDSTTAGRSGAAVVSRGRPGSPSEGRGTAPVPEETGGGGAGVRGSGGGGTGPASPGSGTAPSWKRMPGGGSAGAPARTGINV